MWQIIEFVRVIVAQGTQYGNNGKHRKLVDSSNNNNFGNDRNKCNRRNGLWRFSKCTYTPM
jgi:hypothetical protein